MPCHLLRLHLLCIRCIYQKYKWSEIDAISGFLESNGDITEEQAAPRISAAHGGDEGNFDDEKVRTPDAALNQQLLPEGPQNFLLLKREKKKLSDMDRKEAPGVDWMYALPEDYPNSDLILEQVRSLYAVCMLYVYAALGSCAYMWSI